jgi:transposase
MEVPYPHCAGLYAHKDMVVACMRHMPNGAVRREVRTFETTTKELLALSYWLVGESCIQVAMEATGAYRKPLWHVLSDDDFTLVLANAAHVKNVPGRKIDVNDATWLADLLAHGLIRSSFVRANPGDAQLVAHPKAVGTRAQRPYPAAAKDPGRRQYQARPSRLRDRRLVRESDD